MSSQPSFPQALFAAGLVSEIERALVEIDVLASLALGLTLEELLTLYRVRFPVLQKNGRRLRFDQRGMMVPVKTAQGELVIDQAHETFPAMVPPFTPVDREADYRLAWAHFSALGGQPVAGWTTESR